MRHFILTTASDISQACVKSLTNLTPTAFSPFVFGDTQSEEIAFVSAPGTLASFTGATLRVTIGDVAEAPTGGTYTVTVGANTTAALPYNTTAEALQTAINALASVVAVGSVNVTGAFPTFLLYWSTVGASKPSISLSTALLEPTSDGSASVLTTGTATVRETVGMSLRALPAAVATSWTNSADIWSGTITTNTESAAALLVNQGTQVGEYLVANTVLSISVSLGGTYRTYYQGPCQLRGKNSDLAMTVPPTLASYMIADSNGNVITPSNFNVLPAQLPTHALTGIPVYTSGAVAASSVTNDAQVKRSEMGSASGVATLGTDSKLTASQIPDITVSDYLGSAATQAAMLLLVGQKGDWCIRTDLCTSWIITGLDPTQLSSWTQLSYPAAPVSSVFGRTGAVTATTGDYTAAQVGAATTAQGALADSAVQPAGIANMVTSAAMIATGAIVVGSGGARGTAASTVSGIPLLTSGVPSTSNVTNDAQAKASLYPNTIGAAGTIPIVNAGGTAYAGTAISGDATLASTGALTVNSSNGVNLNSALNQRGTSGGIAFHGVATEKGLATLTNQNPAGDPCGLSIIERSVVSQTALDCLAYVGSSATTHIAAGTLAIRRDVGALSVILYGATTSDYNLWAYAGYGAAYAGKSPRISVSKNAAGNPTIFADATDITALGTFTTAGTAPTWQGVITGTYLVGGLGTATVSHNGILDCALLYNRALTASDISALVASGGVPAQADLGASQVGQTSGSLVIGKRYRIGTFVAGDSFTNVGAASNATGVEFIATGTTPTTWTNSSSLLKLGVIAYYPANELTGSTIYDATANGNNMVLSGGATLANPGPGTVPLPAITATSAQIAAIGATTPGTGAFTTLSASGAITSTSTTAATAVSTGALKGANFGFSGTLGGASFLGGNLSATGILASAGANLVSTSDTGVLKLGGDATYYGLVRYNSAANTTLYVDNAYDNAGAAIKLRTRTLGTPVDAATFTGTSATLAGSLAVGGALTVPTSTPATSGAAGVAGTITWDANYVYVCTATNTWKRVGIATW